MSDGIGEPTDGPSLFPEIDESSRRLRVHCKEARGERWLSRMETGGLAWEPSPVHGPTFLGRDSGSGGAWRKKVWSGRDQVCPGAPSLISDPGDEKLRGGDE